MDFYGGPVAKNMPMQGTWVRSLVQGDFTCRGASNPMRCNYGAHLLQLLKSIHLQPVHSNEE